MKKILSIFMVAVLSLNLLYQPCMATDDKREAASSVTQERISVGDRQADKRTSGQTSSSKAIKAIKAIKAAEKSKPKASFFKKIAQFPVKIFNGLSYILGRGIPLYIIVPVSLGGGLFLRKLISDKERSAYSVGRGFGYDRGYVNGYALGYDNGYALSYEKGYGDAESECTDRIEYANRKAERECVDRINEFNRKCAERINEVDKEAKSKCAERINEVNRKAESKCNENYNIGYNNGHHDGYEDGWIKGYRHGEKVELSKRGEILFPIDKMSKKCLKQILVCEHPDKFECYEVIKDFYNIVQKKHNEKT